MNDLFPYYERELNYIRKMANIFAQKHPGRADKLRIEANKCDDPHTERILQAFALLSGRIHKTIDDGFPEIVQSILNIIYPHYNAPIPSMTIVQFEPESQNITKAGYPIPKRSQLYSNKNLESTVCKFQTCYPVDIWPVYIQNAELKLSSLNSQISIYINTFNNINILDIEWEKIRLHLNTSDQNAFHIYELLCNNINDIECAFSNKESQNNSFSFSLPLDALKPVGFSKDEMLLPDSKRNLFAHQLLFEYFCFPQKFFFFDLFGLHNGFCNHTDEFFDTLHICFKLNKKANKNTEITKNSFSLNTTPVINLFKKTAEPIYFDHKKTEYELIPDRKRRLTTEIYRIDKVEGASDRFELLPFYSLKHHDRQSETKKTIFWHYQRKDSEIAKDKGTDIYMNFRDLSFEFKDIPKETITVYTQCTNRDLPGLLSTDDFNLEKMSAPVSHVKCLRNPTPTRRPFASAEIKWRLISHLSLNFLSMIDKHLDTLKEMLLLYNFDGTLASDEMIESIEAIKTEFVTCKIKHSICRGIKISMTFKNETFNYLLAQVLEHFFANYVSINSFIQLEVILKSGSTTKVLKKWKPRNGNKIIL